ncbi:toxic anion resistance protein [Lactococcus lactis]|uniref:toxic anion resistance protein n=1 Tax=Lactococcus lactis TaxID=1358 RepID=UPI002658ED7C|nr:toxic anion resistance protein [Lactococcus lactis]WKF72451.1 toxic anion resistance protein [Lactococcus lactis]
MDLHQPGILPEEIQETAKTEVEAITGEVIPFTTDLIAPLGEKQKALMTDYQVLQLARQMDLKDSVAIMDLGKEPADAISSFASQILNGLSVADTLGSTKLMDQLGKIMDQFDMQEVMGEKKKGLAGFLQNKARDLKRLLAKYQSLGGEIDKVYQELVKYEADTKQSIKTMKELAEQNINYSDNLDGYIATGYVLQNQLNQEIIPALEKKVAAGDEMANIQLSQMRAALEAVDRRTADLEMSKTTAILTGPQIDLIQKNNVLLLAQLHSAFITTIPQFKMAMIQAVTLQKQKNTQAGLAALNARNNELIRRNAQNLATNSVTIAKAANQTSISVETLQFAFDTMKQAIVDTKAIDVQAKQDRATARQKLNQMETEIHSTMGD